MPAAVVLVATVAVTSFATWRLPRVDETPRPTPASRADKRAEVGPRGEDAHDEQAAGARRRALESPGDPDARAASGAIEYMLPSGEAPAEPTRWAWKNAVGQRAVHRIGERPHLLDPGRWRIVEHPAGWRASCAEVELEPGQRSVVWIADTTRLRILVRDAAGAAVADARVSWFNAFDALAAQARTDADGVAHFESVTMSAGSLSIAASGYELVDEAHASPPAGDHVVELVPSAWRPLVVRDALSSDPVAGAALFQGPTEIARTDESGRADVPARGAGSARIDALGYVPASIVLEAGSGEIPLWPAAACTFDWAGAERALLYADLDADGDAQQSFDDLAFEVDAPPARAVLPRQLRTRVTLVTRDGRVGELDVHPADPSARYSIPLEHGETTSVVSAGDPRAPWVTVHRGDARAALETTQAAEASVPVPATVERIVVGAAERASVTLRPGTRDAVRLAGRVVLELPRTESLVVNVRDPQAAPVAGVRVLASPRSVAVPTSHADWHARVETICVGTSDATGTAQLTGLAVGGRYRISATLPDVRDPFSQAVLDASESEVRARPGASVSIVVGRPIEVEIDVADVSTGRPIHGFDVWVQTPGGDPWRLSVPRAARWRGWISESIVGLDVLADGYLPGRVDLRGGADRHRVLLERDQVPTVRLEGEWRSLVGAPLRYTIFVEPDGGLGGHWTELRSGVLVPVEADGAAALFVTPPPEVARWQLELELLGELASTHRFEQARVDVSDGSAFQVRRAER